MANIKHNILLWLTLSLIGFSSSLFATDALKPVRLFSKTSYPLNLHMYVLEDTTNALTIEHVTNSKYRERFIANDRSILNLGISQSTHWLKVTLAYPNAYPNHETSKLWLLEVGSPGLDVAELFIPNANGIYDVSISDTRSDYSAREITHINSVYPLDMQLGEEITLFIKIKNNTSMYVPLVLWTPEGFVEKVAREEFIYGLFLGGMLILLLYNLFVYFSVRDISYLYYVVYLFGLTLFGVFESGRGLLHLDIFFGAIDRQNIMYVIWLSGFTVIFFAKYFLNTMKNHPRIDRSLTILALVVVISALLVPFFDYAVSVYWNMIYMSAFLPAFSLMLIYCWTQGNKNAKYLFIAWFSNVLGLAVFTGVTFKIIPATTLTLAASQIGIWLEAVVLSFALAHRIKTEQAIMLESDADTMSYLSHYQSIFDNAREGMYKMSLKGNFISANPAMLKMLSLPNSDELMAQEVNTSLRIFRSPREQYCECIEKGVTNNSLSLEKKDGRKIWLDHRAKLISDKLGNPSHIEGTLVDVTQIKLKVLAEKEEQIERNKKNIAEETAIAKSEFLSIMNHEIRTPLTATIGFIELLKDKGVSKEDKDEAKSLVFSNSRRLLQLINDILDLSKIEANMLTIEKLPVDVISLVDQIHSEFSKKALDKDIEFYVDYTYPFPTEIVGDPTRIMQVLRYLCSNAVKFTESGRVTLSILWNKETKEMRFELTDTGIGMDKHVVRNIFREFDQADVSASRQYEGAGLGLAIAKRLTVMMGGTITVSSEVGKGSIFTVSIGTTLPEHCHWIDKPSALSSKCHKISSFVPTLTGTVLLAEDNIVNQKLIEKLLKKTGVDVIIASDGIEACEYCERSTPDFVLMDINMPNRDGLEATDFLRKKGYNLPIYALTAETNEEDINRTLAAGCNGFLSKPINKTLLFRALAECLPFKLNSAITNERT